MYCPLERVSGCDAKSSSLNIYSFRARRYTDNYVTENEFAALPPRLQEQVKRSAAHNAQATWAGYYTPHQTPNRFRRIGKHLFISLFTSERMIRTATDI